jgi:hypothetical protein
VHFYERLGQGKAQARSFRATGHPAVWTCWNPRKIRAGYSAGISRPASATAISTHPSLVCTG